PTSKDAKSLTFSFECFDLLQRWMCRNNVKYPDFRNKHQGKFP
ncbi:hypothetical protein JTE90_027108, partial [Oedothorax gibbosus]